MRSEIISIGTELLLGNIINTNTAFLSEELAKLGIDVFYHVTVGDNRERLAETLRTAMERSDLVITTGGLGPTSDDITKETIAEVAGRKLVLHKDELRKLEAYFNKSGRKMTPNNMKQAYLPEGCLVVANDNGTAPGAIVELDGTTIIMLPGPPVEMKPMFREKIAPYLRERSNRALVSVSLRFFGIGESALEHALYDLIEGQTEPTIATYAGEGEVKVRLTARSDDGGETPPSINSMIEKIKERLDRYIYSYNDRPLHEVTAELLLMSGKTLAVAESCTGGKLSALITSVPGISEAYMGGIVSYSNQMKQKFLEVSGQTLEKYGAVSKETALQMAEGVRKACDADIGLSVTGIAGPDGGTDRKPVGLVYIALSSGDYADVRELMFSGNREKVSTYAAKNALNLLRLYLTGNIASIDKTS